MKLQINKIVKIYVIQLTAEVISMGILVSILFVMNLLIGIGFCTYYVKQIPEGTWPAE